MDLFQGSQWSFEALNTIIFPNTLLLFLAVASEPQPALASAVIPSLHVALPLPKLLQSQGCHSYCDCPSFTLLVVLTCLALLLIGNGLYPSGITSPQRLCHKEIRQPHHIRCACLFPHPHQRPGSSGGLSLWPSFPFEECVLNILASQ